MRNLGLIAVLCLAAATSLTVQAAAASPAKASTVLATISSAPKGGAAVVKLLIAGQDKAVSANVSDTATLGGICHHCGLPLRFKPAAASKTCDACPCGDPMAECIAWVKVKPDGWQSMLAALPVGTGLKVAFNSAAGPSSGIKTLIVDRRVVLLPVDGVSAAGAGSILKLVKPLGGTKVELLNGGKQVEITLKSDWTAQKEAKLDKELQSQGAKIAFDANQVALR